MTASPAAKNTKAATKNHKFPNGGNMSHRFFRNAAGTSVVRISAITGLALGLACGGGNKVTPNDNGNLLGPETPIITGPDVTTENGVTKGKGINLHMYTIKATSSGAYTWEAKLPIGTSSTINPPTETKVGEWQYMPRLLSGNGYELISFQSKNSAGVESATASLLMEIKENSGPEPPDRLLEERIYVSRNVPAFIAYVKFIDNDGDRISWNAPTGTFINAGGSVTIQQSDGLVKFDATGVTNGIYNAVLSYNEVDPRTNLPVVPLVASNTYTITVEVGGYSSGRDPNMDQNKYPLYTPDVKFDTAYPRTEEKTVVFGIPSVFTFRAEDNNNIGNEAIAWRVTSNGVGQSWIASTMQNKNDFIPDTIQGVNIKDSIENENHPNYKDGSFITKRLTPGRGIFVVAPGKGIDNPVGSSTSATLKATATFMSTGNQTLDKSSSDIIFTVQGNTPPTISIPASTSVPTPSISLQSLITNPKVTTALPSAPTADLRKEFHPVHDFSDGDGLQPILVFKGKTQGGTPSWDIRSIIEFDATITDSDLPKGDLLTWKTSTETYVTQPEPRAVYAGKWSKGMDEASIAQRNVINSLRPYFTDGSAWDGQSKLAGRITLNMPEEGQLKYGSTAVTEEGLSFIYTVKDLGGNEEEFAVYVKTKKNEAPVFDAYVESTSPYIFSSGDAEIVKDKYDVWVSGWAAQRPLETATTNWTIMWGDDGKTPALYKVADPDLGEDLDLSLDPNEKLGLYFSLASNLNPPVSFTSRFIEYDDANPTPLTLSWAPTQAGSSYSFKINAFDRYGYAAYPLEMAGVVYRYIRGAKVEKLIYRAEDPGDSTATPPVPARTIHIDRRDADFTKWASVQVDPFYYPQSLNGSDSDKLAGYMSEIAVRIKGFPGDNGKAEWKTGDVPPGPYLVSADRIKGNAPVGSTSTDLVTTAPVVGPAVTSTDMKTSGSGSTSASTVPDLDFAGGNGYAYAYIESSTPNLSTHAGSGLLAGVFDKSLGQDYYDFDLQNDVALTLMSSSTSPSYAGIMGSIANNKPKDNSSAIQFAFPSIGQSAFFDVANAPDSAKYEYPADQYGPSLGWANTLGFAANANFNGTNYNTFNVILGGIGLYQTSTSDKIQLSHMQQDQVPTFTVGPNTFSNLFPYWKMVSTGVASAGIEAKITDSSIEPVNPMTNFSTAGFSTSRVFNWTINRSSFREYLGQQVVWDNSTLDTAGGRTLTLPQIDVPKPNATYSPDNASHQREGHRRGRLGGHHRPRQRRGEKPQRGRGVRVQLPEKRPVDQSSQHR